LLDTHTILWFFSAHPNLSTVAQNLIENETHEKLISIASVWEMAIKQNQKKLNLGKSAAKYVEEKLEFPDFQLLTIDLQHLELISSLESYHRDPFDRLLISQAIAEDITLISKDKAFDLYPVKRIW